MKKTVIIFVLIAVSLVKVNAQIYDASPYCKFRTTYGGGSWDDFSDIQIGPFNQSMILRSKSAQYDSDYIYFNNLAATAFNRGASYSLKINYEKFDIESMVMTVFIDYNQDQVFDADEVAYNKVNLDYQDTTVSGTISIPVTALTGTTRMRVMMMDTNSIAATATANPCAWADSIKDLSFSAYKYPAYGQTVDFDVTIQDATGVSEISHDKAGLLYPNPATDVFYLPKELAGSNIIISDISGRAIARYNEVNSFVDMHTLSTGIYMVRIVKEGQVYNQRLSIVNR